MDEITQPIAEHAASLRFGELPDEIARAAITRLVDTLGCALGGYRSPQASIGRRLAQGATRTHYKGRIFGTQTFSSAELATFANSAAIRYLDFNDTYPGGHPSDCVGALLALAEWAHADGRCLLTSLVVAYETFARIIGATRLREGWSQGFAVGIATAAGLGSLLRLSAEAIGHALAITAASNVALGVTTTGPISQWKGAATAFAARNAVFATLLAAEGTSGPAAPFAGRHGVWEQVTGPFSLEPFGARGGRFLLPLVRLKYWPVQYEAQAAVWAALELRAKVSEPDLTAIEVAISSPAWRDQGEEMWDPRTRETADHSVPFVLARTLRDGTIGVASFEDEAVLDPTLRLLMAKIRLHRDQAIGTGGPDQIELQVTATDQRGTRHTIRVNDPLGHERNQMSAGDVSSKFRSLALPVLGAARAEAALQTCWRVEAAPGISPLMDSVAVDTPLIAL